MRIAVKYAVLGIGLAAALSLPAKAQLGVPCYAFQRDMSGAWNATQPVTVDTRLGLIEVMPGHAVGIGVARALDAQCP